MSTTGGAVLHIGWQIALAPRSKLSESIATGRRGGGARCTFVGGGGIWHQWYTLAPLNIITLCGWSQNTWAAPTFGGLRWVFWAVLVGPQRRQMDKLVPILSFGSSEGPCLQCPLISCRAAHCWSMTAPQLSVLWAWARTLIHRGGPLKIHPVKVIMPEPWSRDRGPDQWGGGAARRGFQGDAATTDSDPPSAVEKPGESSQVKSQRQPLTEALKKSK